MQFQNKPLNADRLRLGWIGGIYHHKDIRLMYEGFNEVFKGVKSDKFQLCLGGFGANQVYQFLEVIYTNEYKNIKSDLYRKYLSEYIEQGNEIANEQPYKRLWGKSVFQYGTLYNEIDVALVPLVEHNFNSFKSQIKIFFRISFKKFK